MTYVVARSEQYLWFEALVWRSFWRMFMNLKALITTLVVGSSSMASADSVSLSGSVSVSLGNTAPAYAPVYRPAPSPNYRPAPSIPARPVVVVQDDCNEPAPIYHHHPTPAPVVYHPTTPVWQAPYYNITNINGSLAGGSYTGRIGTSNIKSVPRQRAWNGYGFVTTRNATTQPWFDLTEATALKGKREFFTIGADKGLFNQLQLQGLGNGSSRIEQVLVQYLDNRGTETAQVFKLKTSITRTSAPITLDLEGSYRSIKRIVVYGATDAGSAYKIQAM